MSMDRMEPNEPPAIEQAQRLNRAPDPIGAAGTRVVVIAPRPPRPPEPRWENFPARLTTRWQWVCWRYCQSAADREWTKAPHQPDGKKASSTDSATWAPFEFAQCAYYSPRDGEDPFDGVGFVLTASDPFTVFDFDHCRDPKTGELDPRIASYVARLDSYTEKSPSGTGLRVVVRAKLPPRDRRIGHIEMYDSARFVSITGHVL
jgi:putative DNA primase/helicase